MFYKKKFIRKRKDNDGQSKKYNSRKIEAFNEKFKSEKEYLFFIYLKTQKEEGKIQDFLFEKEKFILIETIRYQGKTFPLTSYTPDFKIVFNNGKILYVDTKSAITAKKETYRVKMKLFLSKYIISNDNINFTEINLNYKLIYDFI